MVALFSHGGAANAQTTTEQSAPAKENSEEETGSIIVEGRSVQELRRQAREQTRATLARANRGIPTPRYFEDLCLSLIGFPDDLNGPFAERIRANAVRAGAPVAPEGSGCEANAIISLSPDPQAILDQARTKQKWIFANARQSVIRRIAKRSRGAISWSLIECRGRDGRPTGEVSLNGKPEPRTKYPTCENARDTGGIPPNSRNDIILSVTLLDRRRIDGMSIEEVADYVTMRTLLLIDPARESREVPLRSILTLFSQGTSNGEGLTEMDMALLSATYQSGPTDITYSTSRETARRLVEGDIGEIDAVPEQ